MYFDPYKYSSETESRSDSVDMSDEIVEKGHKNILKVDVAKFEELCRKFKEKKDMKIKNLLHEDKTDFDTMVQYVHLLYGTSYYSHLFEKVKKHFGHINSVKPGTIGAYFAGCLINNNNSDLSMGCTLGCAGSMPLPKDEEGWSFCDKAVIMAEKGENDGYIFSVVKPAESQEDYDPAYVFVESGSMTEFSGFDKAEKANLKALGCKKVKLIGYSDDMSYSELSEESVSVDEIKCRKEKKEGRGKSEKGDISHKKGKEDDNGWFIFAVIIFIILLFIFLFLLYKYYRMKNY